MMLRQWVLLSLLTTGFSAVISHSSHRPFKLSIELEDSNCNVLSFGRTQYHKGLSDEPGHYIVENRRNSPHKFDLFAYDSNILWQQTKALCNLREDFQIHNQKVFSGEELRQLDNSLALRDSSPSLRIEPLIQSGPSGNRVDLVFFSDGYTVSEYNKFIADAMRLAKDISSNQTFNTVKPLLNFWAAFSASNESGIGVGGIPKNTTYGLYRDGTELRGVYYSKPEVARASCLSMGDKCDYPILMGNDPLYGGLGGEFTVITPSIANGALVLRHELGHSIIDVGEEYDGGFAYFGVNAAHNLSELPWPQWLSSQGLPRVERSLMPMQAYPWTLLNHTSPWTVSFNSSGLYNRHLVKFSLSGIPDASDLSVKFNGVDLGWEPRKDIGVDRWHYDIWSDKGLEEGLHELRFDLNNLQLEGQAQLCSAEILEYGDETQFNSTLGHYSAYPTFSDRNMTSYRPTNEDCLMRKVTTPNFCKVCLEGLWLTLLKRVDLIDSIEERCNHDKTKSIDLGLVPLAHLRDDSDALEVEESLTIRWSKDGQVLEEYTNQTSIVVGSIGNYSVDVEFATEEVKVDVDGFLKARGELMVGDVNECL